MNNNEKLADILAYSIAAHESGGTFNPNQLGDYRLSDGKTIVKAGTAGAKPYSVGIGQWTNWVNDSKGNAHLVPLQQGQTPSRWKEDAAKILGDKNAPMTLDNQKTVIRSMIKNTLDKYNGDIEKTVASWNVGQGNVDNGKYLSDPYLKQKAQDYLSKVNQQFQQAKQKFPQFSQDTTNETTPVQQPVEQNTSGETGGGLQDYVPLLGTALSGVSSARNIVGNVSDYIGGEPLRGNDTTYDYGVLGKAKGIGSDFDITKPMTDTSNVKAVKDIAGSGIDIGTSALPLKGAADVTARGLIKQGAKTGFVGGLQTGVVNALKTNQDLGNASTYGDIAKNVGVGTALGGGIGLGSKLVQIGAEKLAPKLTEKLSGNANIGKDFAITNAYKRAGLDTEEKLQQAKSQGLSNFRNYLMNDSPLATAGTGKNNFAIKSNIENMSDDALNIFLSRSSPKYNGARLSLYDTQKTLGSDLDKIGKTKLELATELAKNNIVANSAKLENKIISKIQEYSGVTDPEELYNLSNKVSQKLSYYVDKKGNIDFEKLDNALASGNKSKVQLGDANSEMAKVVIAKGVRDYLKNNLAKDNALTTSQKNLLNKYADIRKLYGDAKDAKWIADSLNNKSMGKASGLLSMVGGTLATGGTYNPVLYLAGDALSDMMQKVYNKGKSNSRITNKIVKQGEDVINSGVTKASQAVTKSELLRKLNKQAKKEAKQKMEDIKAPF